MTLKQATNKIKTLGGYAHIDTMPLEQRNAYASTELANSLALNPEWLFEQANKKSIDLYSELKTLDAKNVPRTRYDFGAELINKLV